jgi:tetratricopeptide (TPR) repeat protein
LLTFLNAEEVTKNSCLECHSEQHKNWSNSHHFQAMAPANAKTVLGNFNQTSMDFNGFKSEFFKKDNKFFCKTQDEKGALSTFEISHVFGVEPLQQYLVKRPKGAAPMGEVMPKTQVLPFAWDVKKEQWYHIYAHDPPAPGEPIHWTGWAQNWNHMCADCHVTQYEKNYDQDLGDYRSSYSVGYVDCTACHQMDPAHHEPGYKKIAKGNFPVSENPLIDFEKQHQEMQNCAPCHAHREHLSGGFKPGSKLADHYGISTLREDLYHHDGQIKEEVYVMGSYLQSKMYRHGVRCSNCHDPHSLKIKIPKNGVCAQCHDPAVFDTPKHTFHKIGSTGSKCVECHMPESVYMGIDRRRDHSIRVPRPDLSQKLSSPNACTGCHLDENKQHQAEFYQNWIRDAGRGNVTRAKDLKELDDQMTASFLKWYGEKDRPLHYGEAFHGVRNHKIQDPGVLVSIAGNVMDYGPVTRATAIDLMRFFPTWQDKNLLSKWAKDDSSIIRRTLASSQHLDYISSYKKELLKDPERSVRMATLRTVLTQPEQIQRDPGLKATVKSMQSDLDVYLKANGDQAGSHLLNAQFQQAMGDIQTAAKAYELAIELQPELTGSRSALAQIKEDLGDHETARRLRLDEMELLRRDLRLAPDRADIWYRLGLMSYILKDVEATLRSMNRVLSLEPNHYNAGLFVIQLNERKGRFSEVKRVSMEMLKYYPQDGYLRQVLQRSMQQAK